MGHQDGRAAAQLDRVDRHPDVQHRAPAQGTRWGRRTHGPLRTAIIHLPVVDETALAPETLGQGQAGIRGRDTRLWHRR